MRWEDCEGSQRSFCFQAFSSYTYNTQFFPFPTSKQYRSPHQFISFCALQNSEDHSVTIHSKCSPLLMPLIDQLGEQKSELYTSNSDTSGEKYLQAKDILHHRLPLVAQ